MSEDWQRCEAMEHVGPEHDETVGWRDLGLMCDACYEAFGDTRVLRGQLACREAEIKTLSELLEQAYRRIGSDELANEIRLTLDALKEPKP